VLTECLPSEISSPSQTPATGSPPTSYPERYFSDIITYIQKLRTSEESFFRNIQRVQYPCPSVPVRGASESYCFVSWRNPHCRSFTLEFCHFWTLVSSQTISFEVCLIRSYLRGPMTFGYDHRFGLQHRADAHWKLRLPLQSFTREFPPLSVRQSNNVRYRTRFCVLVSIRFNGEIWKFLRR